MDLDALARGLVLGYGQYLRIAIDTDDPGLRDGLLYLCGQRPGATPQIEDVVPALDPCLLEETAFECLLTTRKGDHGIV